MNKEKVLRFLDNFFFPHKCTFCNNITREIICPKCLSSVIALRYKDGGICLKATYKEFKNLDIVRTFYQYEGIVRKGILHAKYVECHSFLYSLMAYLPNDIKKIIDNENIDIIISVPAHKSKFYENEYDLSKEMTKVIAKSSKTEYNINLVIKEKRTKKQHSLTRLSRSANLRDAFVVKGNVTGKNILIIDDIVTTGHTLDELAGALKKSGAARVVGMTFAHRNE